MAKLGKSPIKFYTITNYEPRVSYKGTDTYENAEQAWSTMSHSGLLIKYRPTQDPCYSIKENLKEKKGKSMDNQMLRKNGFENLE